MANDLDTKEPNGFNIGHKLMLRNLYKFCKDIYGTKIKLFQQRKLCQLYSM